MTADPPDAFADLLCGRNRCTQVLIVRTKVHLMSLLKTPKKHFINYHISRISANLNISNFILSLRMSGHAKFTGSLCNLLQFIPFSYKKIEQIFQFNISNL